MTHKYAKKTNEPDEGQQRQLNNYFLAEENTKQYRAKLNQALPIIMDSIALLNYDRSNLTGGESLKEIQRIHNDALNQKKEYDKLLKDAQEEIAKQSMSKHALIFEKQAINHRKGARAWGSVSILLILTNFALIIILYRAVSDASKDTKLELGILSALLISLMSYFIVQCVRSYFAEKHNQVINQHKANCLGSYNTFVETATDEVKGIILQYTTQTIFSPFNPGFLSKDLMQSPLPFIEMLRTIQTEKKPS